MSRTPSPRIAQRDVPLVAHVQALKAEHPFWGYRRGWATLRYVEGLAVNKKRVWRIMRTHGLLVPPNRRLKACRTPSRSKPRPTRPNEWWGIDMTKIAVESFGWVYLVVVLDWYTKKCVVTFPPKTGPLPARVWGGRTAQEEGPGGPGDASRRSRSSRC